MSDYYRQSFSGDRNFVGLHFGKEKVRVREYCTAAREETGSKVQITYNQTYGWSVGSPNRDLVAQTIDWLLTSELDFIKQSIKRNAIGPLQILDSKTEDELEDMRAQRRQRSEQRRNEREGEEEGSGSQDHRERRSDRRDDRSDRRDDRSDRRDERGGGWQTKGRPQRQQQRRD